MTESKKEISVEELRKYSLMVCTPMYGGMCTANYTNSMLGLAILCKDYGIDFRFYAMMNESLVQRARNYCTEVFLNSGMTHMVFVDADIQFDPQSILVMLGIQVSEPEKYQVLAGPYPKKVIAWDQVKEASMLVEKPDDLAAFAGDFVYNLSPDSQFSLDKPFEVMEAGTGFMLIPRTVLTSYAETYKDQEYIPDHSRSPGFDGSKTITAFFDCKIDEESKRYLSEDYYFCQNVRKMGGSVHIIPWIKLTHVGTYAFQGSLEANSVLHNMNNQK